MTARTVAAHVKQSKYGMLQSVGIFMNGLGRLNIINININISSELRGINEKK